MLCFQLFMFKQIICHIPPVENFYLIMKNLQNNDSRLIFNDISESDYDITHFILSPASHLVNINRCVIHQQGIDGARAEKILDMASITLNKNSVPGKLQSFIHFLYIPLAPCFVHLTVLTLNVKSQATRVP